ncbi:MAG: acyl-CoA synthetase (AMP-forming)/AMP-acid ligase II/acyl carrier protein [Arenicella sp.]|jgi:long-chain acyl-CoA synthetase
MFLKQQLTNLQNSKNIFLQTAENQYSYKQTVERIRQIGRFFQENGISESSNLLLSASEPYDLACLFLACLLNGTNAIVLDPRFKAHKAKQILETLDLDGWISDKGLKASWELPENKSVGIEISKSAPKKGKLMQKLLRRKSAEQSDDYLLESYLKKAVDFSFPEFSADQTAYTLFTSGSSALPKGVQITHTNLFAHLKTLSEQYELTSESRILNILPVFHTDGLIQGSVLSFFAGCSWLRPVEFEISKIPTLFDSIYKHRISHFLTVPSVLSMLLQFSRGYEDSFQTDDFKHIVSSASALEKKLWEEFETKFSTPIANVYGLTETVAGSLFSGPKPETKKTGSLGKAVDCEIKLVNENNQEVAIDEVGEICLKGEHIAKSYLKNGSSLDSENWFYTGDLAKQDSDGFYFLAGRKSNLIISGGVNISAEEVEEAINKHSFVVESCVFGIPDNIQGEKVACAVISKQTIESNQLKSFLADWLEPCKIPQKIHFLTKFPKTLSGKNDRKKLLEMIDKQTVKSSENSKNISEKVKELAIASFGIGNSKNLDIYASSKNVSGWTSLNHLDFVVSMEADFSIKFSTTEIMNINSVQDAIGMVEQKQTAK